MRDRIIEAVVTAIVHNKKTTIAALVAVLGLAAAKLGLHVSADALVYVAGFIVLVIGAAAGDSHQRSPRKGPRPPARTIPLMLVCLALAAGAVACSSADIKAGARASRAGAQELKREVSAEFEAGEISADDADFIRPILDELGAAAGRVADDPRDFDKLSPADRRQIVEQFISDTADAAGQLDAQGALRIKSEAGRRRFEKALRNVRRGLGLARVIEAALPPPQ